MAKSGWRAGYPFHDARLVKQFTHRIRSYLFWSFRYPEIVYPRTPVHQGE